MEFPALATWMREGKRESQGRPKEILEAVNALRAYLWFWNEKTEKELLGREETESSQGKCFYNTSFRASIQAYHETESTTVGK